MGQYNSFLIKVWAEDGDTLVRGHIQHVGTEDVAHFSNWEKMVEFILSHLNWQINHDTGEGVEESPSELKGDEVRW
jgi:hypothetical protein